MRPVNIIRISDDNVIDWANVFRLRSGTTIRPYGKNTNSGETELRAITSFDYNPSPTLPLKMEGNKDAFFLFDGLLRAGQLAGQYDDCSILRKE